MTTSPELLSAHDGKHGAGDVEWPEQVGLDLSPKIVGCDLLEETGIEVTGVVHEDVDASEASDGSLHRGSCVVRVGDIELHDEQVILLTQSFGHAFGVAPSSDDSVPRC